jgi:general secretion pathway protein H
MKRAAGFTLIELLVVFAITALLIGIAPLAFDKLNQSAQYRAALRSMLSELRTARQQAVTQGREVSFRVNLNNARFGIDDKATDSVPPPLRVRATVASQELTQGSAAIRFLPSGGATGGSIELIRPSGSGVRLRVDWLSGRVTQEPLSP